MHITPIQNQIISSPNNRNKMSFGSVEISQKTAHMNRIRDAETLEKYIEHAEKLENMQINLKDMVKKWKLTPSMKYVLKNMFKAYGEEETNNLSVRLLRGRWPDYACFLEYSDFAGKDKYTKEPNLTHIAFYNPENKRGFGKLTAKHKLKEIDGIYLPTEKAVLQGIEENLKERVTKLSEEIDEKLVNVQRQDDLDRIRKSYMEKTGETDPFYYPREKLHKTSLNCTLDDILNYQKSQNDILVFNDKVTDDGESLLMALVHVQPTEENMDKYMELVDDLSRRPIGLIDYNQKDSTGVPFIDHVLNSENAPLLLLASSCADLRYEPELDNTFDNIKDPEFKKMVLDLDIFNNIYNLKYKTIFHRPNPSLD